MSLLTFIKGVQMVQEIKKVAMGRSAERAARVAGAAGTVTLLSHPSVLALIPPEYAVWLIPLISFVFKELRVRFPDSGFLKRLPL